MAASHALTASADAGAIQGPEAGPYRAVAAALEVIPRTLAQNCGANVIRTLTRLRAAHAADAASCMGINGALSCWLGRPVAVGWAAAGCWPGLAWPGLF
jgi:T-complex protein 1 subunit gamma